MAALHSGPIEVRETAEQAVVSKDARVVEEVTVAKDVKERTETIRDTVRHTVVEVEQLPGSTNVRSVDDTPDDRRA
jgi:stress response protein YsnF